MNKESLRLHWQASALHRVCDHKDERGRGRICMMSSGLLASIAVNLTGGIFYSGFLLGYGINIVNIGILTFIPYIASLFSLLSPMLLERFKKRRLVLTVGRALYYTINILGLTLLPKLVHGQTELTVGFGIIVFAASSINFLLSPGYTVWHVNFLPEEIRADYFNLNSLISSLLSGVVVLATSAITDSLAGSPQQLTIIVILRYVAYAIALLDVLALTLPKEYPYPQADNRKPRLADIVLLPLKHKKFMLTMIVMFLYTFVLNIHTPVLNTYLLEDIGVSYTFVNAINASYFLFFIFFSGMIKKLLKRLSWFGLFAFSMFIVGPSYILYAFVTPGNYLWLMTAVRLIQHLCGVMNVLSYSNFPYINLPEESRTNYISFYTVFVNIAALLSMLFGTAYVKYVDFGFTLFGVAMGSVDQLLIYSGVLQVALGVLVIFLIPKMSPEPFTPPPRLKPAKLEWRRLFGSKGAR